MTTSKSVFFKYKYESIEVVSLSSYLGISTKDKVLTLYQVYTYFFPDNTDSSDIMLDVLYNAFIVDKIWHYCMIVGNTVCWFIANSGGIKISGSLSIDEKVSCCSVGRFAKLLRYNLVKSGVGLNQVVFLSWGRSILEDYFPAYKDIKTILNSIDGLRGKDILDIYNLLSNTISIDMKDVTAFDLVSSLSDSYKALGLSFDKNHISYRYRYYRDYSVCKYNGIHSRDCEYFFIFDCEGKTGGNGSLQAGCRQIGGILCARYKNTLIALYKFIGDDPLVSDVLSGLPALYKDITDRPISQGGIPVYIYGVSDSVMIEGQLNHSESKIRKKLSGVFNFINVEPLISIELDRTDMQGKRTLQNIARHLGVYALRPKHNALSDARTLFNILAVLKKGDIDTWV